MPASSSALLLTFMRWPLACMMPIGRRGRDAVEILARHAAVVEIDRIERPAGQRLLSDRAAGVGLRQAGDDLLDRLCARARSFRRDRCDRNSRNRQSATSRLRRHGCGLRRAPASAPCRRKLRSSRCSPQPVSSSSEPAPTMRPSRTATWVASGRARIHGQDFAGFVDRDHCLFLFPEARVKQATAPIAPPAARGSRRVPARPRCRSGCRSSPAAGCRHRPRSARSAS